MIVKDIDKYANADNDVYDGVVDDGVAVDVFDGDYVMVMLTLTKKLIVMFMTGSSNHHTRPMSRRFYGLVYS